MNILARLPRIVMTLIVASFVIIPATATAAPLPAAACTNIDATAEGYAYPILDGEFNLIGFDIEGSALGGTVTGTNWVQKITPGGVIHFSGVLTFDTPEFGVFKTTDEGVTTANGRLNTTLRLIEGGSGFISSHGTIFLADPETFTYEWHVHERGRICTS